MPDIGPKIGVDGEKQFRQDIARVAQSLKTLNSEMKTVKSSFEGQAKTTEQLKKENDVLERSVYTLRDKLKMQEEALKKCADKYGEADVKTMKWQQAVNETTAALNEAENQIRKNNSEMEGYGEAAENASKSTFNLKSTLADIRSATAVTAVVEAAKVLKDIGTAAFEAAENSAIFADDINTLAKVTGLSTEALQAYQYMSELVDIDMNTLTTSMARLIKNMNNARKGTEDATAAFEMLGINVVDGNGILRDNKDVFIEVIDALSMMTDETERDAAAMAIFGESAQNLNPLILESSDALKSYMDEAERLGLIYSQEELDKLNAFNDSIYKAKKTLEGFRNDIVLEYVDEFNGGIETATNYVQKLREAISENGLRGAMRQLAEDYYSDGNWLWSFKIGLDAIWNSAKTLYTTLENLIGKINIFKSESSGLGAGLGGYGSVAANVQGAIDNAKRSPSTSGTINIYPRTMSRADTDYVIKKANSTFGGKL